MTMLRRWWISLAACVLMAGMAAAVLPDEVLADPALEARARALSQELRCLVCQNESIDESNAPLARDLRLIVRERLMAGDTDAEVLAFVEARYGAYVRLRPAFNMGTLLLWIGPFLVLLAGLSGILVYVRRVARTAATPEPGLSPEEERRLRDLSGS